MDPRFSPEVGKIMQLANQEAHCLNHEYIGTEHVLLGLVRHADNVAAKFLRDRGIDVRVIRAEVEKLVRSGPDMVTAHKLPMTPRTKRAIELALEESVALGHQGAGPEHLLLGLLREGDGVAAQVLAELGLGLAETRRKVADVHPGIRDGADKPASEPIIAPPITFSLAELETATDLTSQPSTAILRILDASSNRAAEGLRVVEDYLRFVLDDPLLTEEAKTLRHDLASAVELLGRDQLVASRDIPGDVGVDIKTETETRREHPAEVLAANLHRAAQALRSLGEYSKIIAPQVAPRFEAIRYHVYQLESTIAASRDGAARLADVRLYVLADGRESPDAFIAFVDALLAAGVHAIQLRDKNLSDRELLDRGRALRERITRFGARTLFILNDRPDLAVLCDADGVHVGQEELTVADARKIVGPRKLVGVSTHSLDQARQAVLDGANYIGVGPTFPSATKEFAEFPGVALLKDVAAATRLPAFAIGGITLDNLDRVLATGIGRAAVSGAIASAADPAEAVRKWLARLESKTP
ncbi:MAG: thiamine phosphate synthase [Planctomycetota bacterium]|nr:MAG: thiamine phosphate synthase [Planctomycetota bacterium]